MKLAILEDRPWIVLEMIKEIKELGIDEVLVVYYRDGKRDEKKIEEIKAKYESEQVQWEEIDNLSFEKTMDRLFADNQRIFFFDLALNDKAEYFEERINVQYATKRFEQGDTRIWFYTTSDEYNINKINTKFENHSIPVVDYIPSEGKLVFSIPDVKRIIEEQMEIIEG